MENRLKVVIDTNVLLVSIFDTSPYHWLFQALIQEEFDLAITNEILTEYEEIISNKYSITVAESVVRTLLLLPNVIQLDTFYNWYLITSDADDNKFADCAIAANADYIVTNDKHFKVLKDIKFPAMNFVNISQFQVLLHGV